MCVVVHRIVQAVPHINVTWYSWFSALTEIGTGIIFGFIGIRAANSQSCAFTETLADNAMR
jgi:hypothetical protein